EFGCTVPQWVKTELNVWIGYIQNDQGPLDDGLQILPDGGSGYGDASGWVNELKTGNLIFEMTFYGDNPSVQRFKDAIDYIERHWNDLNMQPGFRGDLGIDDDTDGYVDEDPYNWIDDDGDGLIDEDMGLTHHYQAIYCLMKGLEYSGISHLDLDMDNIPEHNWYAEFADMLIGQQNADGSWPSSPSYVWEDGSPGTMSGDILSTVWALLTLERIAPPTPPFIEKHFTYTDVEFTPYVWEPIEFYLEDFEGDCPPVGWTIYEAPINGDTWICNNILTSACEYGGASGIFMEFDDDDYGSESDNPLEELITAPIDCSIYRNIYLSFDGDFEDMAGGGMFWVHISNDGGLTWTEVLFVTEDLVGGFPAHPDIPIDISSLADFESDVRIKFTYSDLYDGGINSWGWGVLIDNVRLNGEHYVLQPAELGTPLDSIDIVIRGKNQLKVKSTNPGQFYAVATITGHIQDLVLYDIFDEEFDINPAKLGGGVEVIMVDPDGYATVLTDHPGVSAVVYNDDDELWVYVYLDDPIPIGHKLMIYIKFQTSMKHEEYTGDDEFENTFWLWDWDAGEFISTVTEALPINY
ncbi:MAG: hypothetical protein JSV67_01545, partial [Thermoplasmatales archaeon]